MTDNQDSKIKVGVQTPPTDRPLTAGDVHLLREGDVLKCTSPGGSLDEGQEFTFVRTAPRELGRIYLLDRDYHPFLCDRFTFVSRPAASDEGVTTSVPVEGQCFTSEQDWINRASRALTCHADYNNTEHGDAKGWRGPHFTALCFDRAGNRIRNGADFKRATHENTYPVWWIWPDQIVPALASPPVSERERELSFLLDRLTDFENALGESAERIVREWHGHVAPSIARLSALTSQPAGEK